MNKEGRMSITDSGFIWPEIFGCDDPRKLANKMTDADLCADGLTGWGICMSGCKPTASFGDAMVIIAERLGSATSDSLMQWADEHFPDKLVASDD